MCIFTCHFKYRHDCGTYMWQWAWPLFSSRRWSINQLAYVLLSQAIKILICICTLQMLAVVELTALAAEVHCYNTRRHAGDHVLYNEWMHQQECLFVGHKNYFSAKKVSPLVHSSSLVQPFWIETESSERRRGWRWLWSIRTSEEGTQKTVN